MTRSGEREYCCRVASVLHCRLLRTGDFITGESANPSLMKRKLKDPKLPDRIRSKYAEVMNDTRFSRGKNETYSLHSHATGL